ncbi:hypothetical protein F5H01DRAFT_334299 [Linnemannia elongata]|nr:hypothetical protein F5H01DRAFT_334299 [Linnemannia elongata]
MDLTRLSSPPRQPSRLPTARTSVSSGRNARLPSLSASPTKSRPTKQSKSMRRSRKSLMTLKSLSSLLAKRRFRLTTRLSRLRSPPPRLPKLKMRLSSSIPRRMSLSRKPKPTRRMSRRSSSPRRLVLLPSLLLPRVLPGSARSPLPLVPLLLVLVPLPLELELSLSEPSMAPPLELDMLPTVLWRRSMVCGSALSKC